MSRKAGSPVTPARRLARGRTQRARLARRAAEGDIIARILVARRAEFAQERRDAARAEHETNKLTDVHWIKWNEERS